jgi:purine-binding chemotaxis protein CheW
MYGAVALREAFDASFATVPPAARAPEDDFIVLGMGTARRALALRQLGGFHADLEIVPCLSTEPDFLGLAVFRGLLLPVYDLALLVSEPAGSTHRWIALNPARDFAIAFERIEATFRAPAAGDRSAERVLARHGHLLPLIDLPSLEQRLRERADRLHPSTERL